VTYSITSLPALWKFKVIPRTGYIWTFVMWSFSVSLMISDDFRHLPTLLPPNRTLKSTCMFVYLPLSHACMNMQRDWKKTKGILFFRGVGRTSVWSYRITLPSKALLVLEPAHQKFLVMGSFNILFHEQFCWRWIWIAILLIYAF
jgi:hypothetical protein